MQAWLGGLVCMRIDAGGDGGHPLAPKFGVKAFPTLVLMEPSGKVLLNSAGAPPGEHFVDAFVVDEYNAAVDAYNGDNAKGAAPHLFFVRKWFAETRLGKEAQKMYEALEKEEGFKEAYQAAEAAYAKRLEEARAAGRKAEERRAKAKALKAEADAALAKYLRTKAFDLYRQILKEYPDLPEADAAREILKKNKQKLTK